MPSEVVGTGKYLPEKVIPNSYFEGRNPFYHYYLDGNIVKRGKKVITSNEWIMENMGIRERREAATDEYVHHLGAKAAETALKAARISAEDLEGIIVATVTQQMSFPSAAGLVQELIGARNATNVYDVGAACAGFPLALWNAHLAVQQSRRPYLIIAAETLRKITDGTDVNAPLFGDGAGAAIVSYTEKEKGVLAYCAESNPFGGRAMWIFEERKMDKKSFFAKIKDYLQNLFSKPRPSRILRMPEGPKVMKEAVESMYRSVRNIKEQLGWSNDDVDLVIPHQANIRILEQVARKSGLQDKVFVNIEKYGNMSSATCAVALSEAIEEGRIKGGSKVIVTSIGSGLVTTAVGVQF